jgi:tetratricopeptide (TPR) repeat protein
MGSGTMSEVRAGRVFVGRERELADLRSAVERARDKEGSLFLISGSAGLGKTRLASEVAAEAAALGTRVVWGRCWQGSGAPPYHPWIEVLRRLRRGRATRARSLADLLDLSDGQRDEQDPDVARFSLFDATASAISDAAEQQPLLLVLDDLQWADVPSIDLAGFIGRTAIDDRVLTIATYRDDDIARDPARAKAIADAARYGEHRRLAGLRPPEIKRYVAALHGHQIADRTADDLYAATGGNPFFLDETLRLLSPDEIETGRLRARLTHGIAEAIRDRAATIDASSLRAIEVASVIGREFALPVLEMASDLPRDAVIVAIGAGVAAGLLEHAPMSLGTHSFAHDLAREALYEGIEVTRRAELHRRVGDALEVYYSASDASHAPELAYHYTLAALDQRATEKAIRYSERAADEALNDHAYDPAVRLLTTCVDLAKASGSPPTVQCALLMRLGDAQMRAGRVETAVATYADAAAIARVEGDAQILAWAALGAAEIGVRHGQLDADVTSLLEEARIALGDEESPLAARVLSRCAGSRYYTAEREVGLDQSRRAVEMARRTGDEVALAYVLRTHVFSGARPTELDERHELTLEGLALATSLGDRALIFSFEHRAMLNLLEMGDPTFEDRLDTLRRIAADAPRPLWQSLIPMFDAGLHLLRGSIDQADRLAAEGYRIGEETGNPNAFAAYGGALIMIRHAQGRLGEIADALGAYADRFAVVTA